MNNLVDRFYELKSLNDSLKGTDFKVLLFNSNSNEFGFIRSNNPIQNKENRYIIKKGEEIICIDVDQKSVMYFLMGYFKCLHHSKNETKQLIEYKFRAECEHDVELFYNENKDTIYNLKYIESDLPFSIDAIATFESRLDLKQIISLMKKLPDTHVMCETVKPINEYTGIRVPANCCISEQLSIEKEIEIELFLRKEFGFKGIAVRSIYTGDEYSLRYYNKVHIDRCVVFVCQFSDFFKYYLKN